MDRYARVLESWLGTRYMPGQLMKGVGVDCRYFLVGVMDEMYRIPADLPLPPRLDPWIAHHDRDAAVRATRAVMSRWPCSVMRGWTHDDLEPGDVVLIRRSTRTLLADPGHVMLVGVRPRELWHSDGTSDGVCRTGFGMHMRYAIRAWRGLRKDELWS
jgi:hypothetical protein